MIKIKFNNYLLHQKNATQVDNITYKLSLFETMGHKCLIKQLPLYEATRCKYEPILKSKIVLHPILGEMH